MYTSSHIHVCTLMYDYEQYFVLNSKLAEVQCFVCLFVVVLPACAQMCTMPVKCPWIS